MNKVQLGYWLARRVHGGGQYPLHAMQIQYDDTVLDQVKIKCWGSITARITTVLDELVYWDVADVIKSRPRDGT